MRGNTNAGGAYRPVGPTGDLERRRAGLTRKVPTKVEPKVFFANERTYLAWLHMSMILATFSIGILSLSEKQGADRFAQAYGLVLMPVAIAFCVYALHMFMRRAAMLRRRDPGPWDERVAPTVLGVMLMVAIVTNFSLKIYDIYNPN
uniref:DUF202 domain-containing protein n=1 Tax=Florenciella parvula TaxID=236787 RepID=A0A7S2CA59_9STRA|mmetsp:Transcript_25769/g.53279  ORF Transcript_25769/g.53279 Transcript_25769/m.53279 type:complete len:147 (+) Transcript_25769:1-441(+)